MEILCSQNKYLVEKQSFKGKYANIKNIKFPRGNYQTDGSKTWTLLDYCLNPLTPVLAVTGLDEPWPKVLPLLTSSLLTKIGIIYTQLLQEKMIFPMLPRSEWSALWSLRYMHKNAKKVEWKTQSKISCYYIWLLRGKNCRSWWCFLRCFLTASKPSRRPITAEKRKEKEEKERRKKNFRNRKALRRGHFFISKFGFLIFVKRDASGKKGKLSCCKCPFDQIKANLAHIQPENHQNVQKTFVLAKSSRSQLVRIRIRFY